MRAKAIFLNQKDEKHNFHLSNAVLLVSVGQSNHENFKLAATIELINKKFHSCDVAVCDVLQRYTLKIFDYSADDEIYTKSKIQGSSWIERNNQTLKSLKIQHKIFRWEEYLLHSDFESYKKKIILTYQEDEDFKNAMNLTISAFLKRFLRRVPDVDERSASQCCFQYLAEECAIIMLMWQRCNFHYIIYPGKMPAILNATRKKFVEPFKPDLLKWLTVYVRSK